MSETLESVGTEVDQRQLAEQLLAQAKEQGVELVGPNGLLNQLTKNVLETALDAEMAEHLGYDNHDPVGRGSGNSRNGARAKTVFTEIGAVEIEVPRDTNSTFDPVIVQVELPILARSEGRSSLRTEMRTFVRRPAPRQGDVVLPARSLSHVR